MGPEAQPENLAQMRARYVAAPRKEKSRLLDEAVAVTGPALEGVEPRVAGRPAGPAAGYPWSQRLKALLPTWLPWARRRPHGRTTPGTLLKHHSDSGRGHP